MAMAVETRLELVGKRFLCVAVGEEARPERRESGRCLRGWRAGVIRAVSHRDSRNPDLAVRERVPLSLPAHARTAVSGSTLSGYLWHLPQPSQLAVTPLFGAVVGFALVPCWGLPSPRE